MKPKAGSLRWTGGKYWGYSVDKLLAQVTRGKKERRYKLPISDIRGNFIIVWR